MAECTEECSTVLRAHLAQELPQSGLVELGQAEGLSVLELGIGGCCTSWQLIACGRMQWWLQWLLMDLRADTSRHRMFKGQGERMPIAQTTIAPAAASSGRASAGQASAGQASAAGPRVQHLVSLDSKLIHFDLPGMAV